MTDVFVKCLNERGAFVVVDGEKFLQVVPSAMKEAISPRSKDLPLSTAEIGAMRLVNADASTVVDIYGSLSERRRKGSGLVAGTVPYFHTVQSLSKPEARYALEILLDWNGSRIVFDNDDTFSIVRGSR